MGVAILGKERIAMALTGQANTDREYMRRRRAKLAQAVGLGS
jgi:hypothetical protein